MTADDRGSRHACAYRFSPAGAAPPGTRDELLVEAAALRRLAEARRSGPHTLPEREIQAMLAEAKLLDAAAADRPAVPSEGRGFYVTIRDGKRYGLLYGPLATQAAALEALPIVRQVAHKVNSGDAAFAEFGTASLPIDKAKPGILNDRVSDFLATAETSAGTIVAKTETRST